MKFVLSLVLVAYVATAVESGFLQGSMDAMKKLTSSDSYSSPSYSAPSSYSAPVYQEAQPIYVVKPESTEYVTEVHKVKHVPVYPVKKYKTKHVYTTGYGSGESYSRESDEYGTYNSGSHVIYRREAPQPSPSARFWQNLAQKPGNDPRPEHPVSRRWAPENSRSSEEHEWNWNNGNNGNPGNNWNNGNNGNPGNPRNNWNNGNNGNPGNNWNNGNNGNPGQHEPWRG